VHSSPATQVSNQLRSRPTQAEVVHTFSVPVVDVSFLRVGKCRVREPHGFESLVGVRGRVLVGMDLERNFPIGFFDLRLAGVATQTQHAVMRAASPLLRFQYLLHDPALFVCIRSSVRSGI